MEKLNSIIIESISEFSYIDIYLEKKSNVIDDEILILSNGTEYEDNLVMYSFFINRKHISSE
jgi:hypothetical protein